MRKAISVRVLSSLLLIGWSIVTKAEPLTQQPWQEVVLSVTDLDRTAEFFTEIGGYKEKWRGPIDPSELRSWGLKESSSGEALVLSQGSREEGFVRLLRFDNVGFKQPTRPGSRSWDSGCFFSIMVRMRDMQSVYRDAIELGWWTETPITQHTFGESRLNIVVFQGPDGVQVQSYERLSLPIPEAFPEFERFSGPFNLMQMVRDRDASHDFFTRVLGFATFYNGKPYVSEKPVYMPLGIPKNLTTTARYRTSIVYPLPGELGRLEAIEMMDLDGHDYAERCKAPNLGILAVRYPVENAEDTESTLQGREWPIEASVQAVTIAPYGKVNLLAVKTPDGANIQFYEPNAVSQ